MIGDAITAMQAAVKKHLALSSTGAVELDGLVSSKVRWRPHVYQTNEGVGWQLHSIVPDSNFWERRIAQACSSDSKLGVGIAVTEDVARSAEFLLACQRLAARLIILKQRKDDFIIGASYGAVPDFVCERRIKLDKDVARIMLDLALDRTLKARTNAEKGVTLEALVALALSQVDNFEIADIGISNRTQQMDVLVHNRGVGGILGASPLVLAEAKNWRKKVTPTEHALFLRKLTTRHRRAKLGFLVTTGKFTAGLALEARRESKEDVIVVFVDGVSLPNIWRSDKSITDQIERIVMDASIGV